MRGFLLCLVTLTLVALLCAPAAAFPGLQRFGGGSGACPNCRDPQPSSGPEVQAAVTVEVAAPAPAQKPETVSEAAKKLRGWRNLPDAEVKRLEVIVNAPAREKAKTGHYGPGSCGMLSCRTHPEQWVLDDEESQEETDARTIPWGNGGGRFRVFRGRR